VRVGRSQNLVVARKNIRPWVLALRRFAEAIEKREKNHAEGGGHEGVYKQMEGEQGRGMVQQNALGERQDRLVEVKEKKDETEAA
jgi:hypothetical protein